MVDGMGNDLTVIYDEHSPFTVAQLGVDTGGDMLTAKSAPSSPPSNRAARTKTRHRARVASPDSLSVPLVFCENEASLLQNKQRNEFPVVLNACERGEGPDSIHAIPLAWCPP